MWQSAVCFCAAWLLAAQAYGQNVKIDVMPKVALVNPYIQTSFRIKWRIEPNQDNRQFSLSYDCGSELHSSQIPLEGDKSQVSFTRYVNLTVLTDCYFLVCVHRKVQQEVKNFCDYQVVVTTKAEQQ